MKKTNKSLDKKNKTKKLNFIFKWIIFLFPVSVLANQKIADVVKSILEAASEGPT